MDTKIYCALFFLSISFLNAASSSSVMLESPREPFTFELVSTAEIEEPSFGTIDPCDISAATKKEIRNGGKSRGDGITIEKYALGLHTSDDLILCIDEITEQKDTDIGKLVSEIYGYDLPSEVTTQSTKLSGHKGPILALDVLLNLLGDYQKIVSGSADGTIKIWPNIAHYFYRGELGTERVRTGTGHAAPVSAVAWSKDYKITTIVPIKKTGSDCWPNRFIISASHDKTIRLWSQTGEPICTFFDRLTANPTAIAWSFDNRLIVVGLVNGMVEIWNVATGRRIQSFEASSRAIRSLFFDYQERQVIIVAADHVESRWHVESQYPDRYSLFAECRPESSSSAIKCPQQ